VLMVLEKCAFTLYSTRVMHALFGFKSTHSSPASYLSPVPTASPYDTGAAYVTPIAFVPHGSRLGRRFSRR
jgi:hypothetical protein